MTEDFKAVASQDGSTFDAATVGAVVVPVVTGVVSLARPWAKATADNWVERQRDKRIKEVD